MRVAALLALLLAASPALGEETSLPICVREPETERDGLSFLDAWVATARVVVAREPCPVPGPGRYVGRFEKRGREVVFVLATPTSGRLEKTIPWLDRADFPLSDLLKAGRLSEFSVWVEALLAEDRLLTGWRLPESQAEVQPKPGTGSTTGREGSTLSKSAAGSGAGLTRRGGSNGSTGVGSSGPAGTGGAGLGSTGSRSTGTGAAASGSAGSGAAGTGSAGTGSAGTGSAGTGSTGSGSTGSGSTGSGSADTGSAGMGSAGMGSAGMGSAGTGSAGTGSAGSGSSASDSAGGGTPHTGSSPSSPGGQDSTDPSIARETPGGREHPSQPGSPGADHPVDGTASPFPTEAGSQTSHGGTEPADEGRGAGAIAHPSSSIQLPPGTEVVPDEDLQDAPDWDPPFGRRAERDLWLRVAGGVRFRSPRIVHPEIALGMILGPAYVRAGWQFPVTWSMGDYPVEARGFSFEAGWAFSLWERGSWEIDGRLGLAADRFELLPLYASNEPQRSFWDGGVLAGSGLGWRTGVGIGVRLAGAVLWMPTAPLTRVGEVGPRATVNSVGGRLGIEISFPE